MLEKRILAAIRTIPDFPKKGIDYKDITQILIDPVLTRDTINTLVEELSPLSLDAVAGVESRGWLFGVLLAQGLQVPFIPIRKEVSLPGNMTTYSQNIEYGSASIGVRAEDVPENGRILIHDDILATGVTAAAAAELLLRCRGQVAAFAFILNLGILDGAEQLMSYSENIYSLVDIE